MSISCWVSSYGQAVLTQVFPHELFTAQLLPFKSVYEVLKGCVDEIDRHNPELCGDGCCCEVMCTVQYRPESDWR